MADIANIGRDLDQIKEAITAKLDKLSAEIQALKDQLANSIPVTQADLDALDAKTEDIKAQLGVVDPPV